MKEFSGKTLEEALELASNETGIAQDKLLYTVQNTKKGLFSKKVVIEVNDLSDVIKYAEDYILNVIDNLGIESSVKSRLEGEDDIIRITIDSTHNPILIGKNGVTLQALNELTKLAVSNHFRRRFRVLLDVNGYKDHKYGRLIHMARKFAKEVQQTKTTYTFDPMPADERRAIHNAVSGFEHIKTESIGEGTHRQVQLIYID